MKLLKWLFYKRYTVYISGGSNGQIDHCVCHKMPKPPTIPFSFDEVEIKTYYGDTLHNAAITLWAKNEGLAENLALRMFADEEFAWQGRQLEKKVKIVEEIKIDYMDTRFRHLVRH